MSNNWGYYNHHLNYGKHILKIDLRHNKTLAIEVITNILIENNAPNMLKTFGLSFEDIRHFNPSIIYTSIKG